MHIRLNNSIKHAYQQLMLMNTADANICFFFFALAVDSSRKEGCNGSEYAMTYEDKDGDLMLVGDVPWE